MKFSLIIFDYHQKEEKNEVMHFCRRRDLLFCSIAYAADDCDSEYSNLIKELEDSNMLEKEKEKYIPELKKALQLCKEGKDAEAEKIVKD